jgi:hypothetical protein
MYATIFRLPDMWNGAVFSNNEPAYSRSWRSSEHVCALSDDERHFGHVIKTQLWDAYDATHPNEASRGFKYLGAFDDLAAAMQAVESSVEKKRESRAMHAAAAWADTF